MAREYIRLVAVVWVAGCGGTGSGQQEGICSDESSPAPCGETCEFDTDCGDTGGFHCTGENVCHSECTQTVADSCGAGERCNGVGRCVAEDADDCPSIDVAPELIEPTIVVLVDRSKSMDDPFEGSPRWDVVRDALVGDPSNEADVGVIGALEDKVNFGVTFYHSEGGGSVPDQCPILVDAPAMLNNASAISTLFVDNAPVRDTPTGESVQQLTLQFPDSGGGPKILVLATDGIPDRCDAPNGHDQISRDLSESAVQGAHAAGITTHVLWVGTLTGDVGLTHLDRLANAGQGLALDGSEGQAESFVGNTPANLEAHVNTIIRGARSCDFPLARQVRSGAEGQGTVTLNGAVLVLGTDYQLINNNTTLQLTGSACQTFQNSNDANLSADWECGTVVE